jgi:hypothetical protein
MHRFPGEEYRYSQKGFQNHMQAQSIRVSSGLTIFYTYKLSAVGKQNKTGRGVEFLPYINFA